MAMNLFSITVLFHNGKTKRYVVSGVSETNVKEILESYLSLNPNLYVFSFCFQFEKCSDNIFLEE
jgi:hypothetical protein